MIPRLSMIRLPMIRSSRITVVKPSRAWPQKYFIRDWIPNTIAKNNVRPPATVIICKGADEKPTIFLTAYFTDFR